MLVCILCCRFLVNWVRFCPVLYWASLLRLRILLSASSWDRNESIHISCVSISTWKCIWPSQWGKYFLVALNGAFHMGFAACCVWIKINVWECVLLAVAGTAWAVAPVGGAEHPDLAMPRGGETGPGGFLISVLVYGSLVFCHAQHAGPEHFTSPLR